MIKLKNLHWFAITLIYISFFALIGFAIYYTKSAKPLWALLLTPTYRSKDDEDDKKESVE